MKRILIAVVLTFISNSAFAVCGAIPLPILDGGGVSRNMSTATAADGNCKTYIDADTSSQLHADMIAAIPAGTNLIGKVGIDQTTPGTTNGVQVNAALPAGTNTIGNTGSDPSSGAATPTQAFLALPATTTTQIVALSGTKLTYVTSRLALAGGTVNVTFKYGTGSNCGTGTTTLDGPWPLTAQAGFSEGNGVGAVMIVPAGQALCVTTDASVTGGVKLTYQQK